MKRAGFIDESEVPLEFHREHRHVDIRHGILRHGVLDLSEDGEPRVIDLGLVGSSASNAVFLDWLQKSPEGIDAKDSPKPTLFPRFPGFSADSPFGALIRCHDRSQRAIGSSDIAALAAVLEPAEIVKRAVALYLAEIEYLVSEVRPTVIACVVTEDILQHLERAAAASPRTRQEAGDDGPDTVVSVRHDFHHSLKAAAMRFHTPIQLILPSTFGVGSKSKAARRKRSGSQAKPRQLQDAATLAWNLFTALYYKAGGVPWRLPRESSAYDTCYVGIGFYKTLDAQRVMTSIAQVFNQRGEGIVVRGGQARISKDDRTPHLAEADASALLTSVLARYREEHKNYPARLVVHKTSAFDDPEIHGVRAAVQQERIAMCDMVSIRKSSVRLFRSGVYPTLRGTHVSLGPQRHLLYTRGSVPFFETYPGLYAPRATELGLDATECDTEALCKEVLALTKMNWNNTQFDMRDPITIRAARRVGDIMKYVHDDAPEGHIARRYSFYM